MSSSMLSANHLVVPIFGIGRQTGVARGGLEAAENDRARHGQLRQPDPW